MRAWFSRVLTISSCLGVAWSAAGVTIDWTGEVDASAVSLSQKMAEVGGVSFYAFQNLDNAQATATGISGFSSLAGMAPGDLGFRFGDLELVGFSREGGYSFQSYGDTDGSPNYIEFMNGSTLLALGHYESFVVRTVYSTGVGTAFGQVHLVSAGSDPGFYNEVFALSGGTGLLGMTVNAFTATALFPNLTHPEQYTARFRANGQFSVPDGGATMLLLCCALSGMSVLRNRFAR